MQARFLTAAAVLLSTLATGAGSPTAVLGRAGLCDLASMTAKSLQDKGIRSVTLGFDDSLFSGPALNPRWASSDSRLSTTSLCGETFADSRLPRGLLAKYSSDSAADTRSTFPSTPI